MDLSLSGIMKLFKGGDSAAEVAAMASVKSAVERARAGKGAWRLLLSPDGESMAIIQDSCVVIRHKRYAFTGRKECACMLPRAMGTATGTGRTAAWSLDSSFLAVSGAMGDVFVCTRRGLSLQENHARELFSHMIFGIL